MKNNIRHLRRHPRWRDYLALADIVQMNLAELRSIFDISLTLDQDIVAACRQILALGPKVVIITMGARGAIAVRGGGEAYRIAASPIPREIDPTGCGDTLSASFVSGLAASGDFVKSLEKACHYAAAKATFSGLEGFTRFDDILAGIGPPPRAVL